MNMNEPKLRFKADDGSQFPEWEEKTFNDVADYKKGPFGSALKKEIFVPKSNDTVKVYEQQNTISKDWKLERYFVTNEYFQLKMKSFAVSGGDIIVSCAGTIGEMYELPDDAEKGIINQALMRVRIKKSVINSIIFRCAFDKMISTEGVKISNGSALKNIPPFADMKKQSVFVPSLPEQQKIAEFLSTIDTVIEKQKKTVSAWEERKKGVMQKLFSQEVRFKADDESDFPEWKKKKIGDVCEQTKETIDPMDKPKNLFVEYSMPAYDNEMKPDIVHGNTMNSIRKVIRKPCVLINKLNVRKRRIWNVTNPENNAVCSAEFVPLTSDVMNLTFVTYFALTDWFTKYLLDCSTGSSNSQKRVTPDVILNVKMPIPCLAEQQKIADCLSSLDEVIEKQKATLTVWEELKKGLLQQMFV